MMKLKHNFKKGLALVLALAMVAGSDLVMPGGTNKVQAATGTGTAPSVTAFATKDQLMTAFNPDSNGNATTIGRLVFGKNSYGKPQEWYILGADSGVSGGKDNTIIFAASPIAKGKVFEDDYSHNKTFDSSFGVYESNPSDVYANHYGASELRGVLQSMASNTSYFTSAEQGLMNNTTVTTKDTMNSSVTYTITDKLYALQGNYNNAQYLWAGSSDSTVLAMSSFWNSGDWFWLRSPCDSSGSYALLAGPGNYVCYINVYNVRAVQPASNLNLSSVLFASAAMAASSSPAELGTIASGTAMTLRLDGTGKNIGTAEYSATTGDIKADKGSTSQPVSLVVQGNDGTNDWYYNKQIEGPETVNALDIKSALSLTSDIDLSACKIWLEITEDNVSYAVNAEKEIEKINTTYVTKDELMTAFEPNANGTETNYGKLVFGKNSSGTPQEWYILGKDSGVSGDNTIIFAASPIAKNQAFEDDYFNNKAFQINFGVYESAPTEVYPNHYGASDLRAKLKTMATNTSYFTTAEQSLMNATTVTTEDKKNSTAYTTTDKLYALAADGLGDSYTTIKAGSDNSTILAMSSYWDSGARFWLRSPKAGYGGEVLLTYPADHVYSSVVNNGLAVQPASNLNLSSVLFASAAEAASSDTAELYTIASYTTMTLRLEGTGKNIGTVTYNTTTGDIKAAKGSTSQTVAIVVQGNDGTDDWYYSKQITGTETINASDIKLALGMTSDIDLSACKIWLETTDSTENLTYAVNATEAATSNITSVAITDIDTPTANTALDTSAACATTGVSSTTPQITWKPSNTTAGYNTSYTASITLTADTGYKFVDSTTATINGNTATSVNKNTDGTLTVTYAFPATAKDKLTSITAPQAITVANGTAYSAMNLPDQVNIVTEGNTESSAPVTWDTTTPASGSYDPAVLTKQTVTLNGTVDCPDSIDANGVSLTTTITITISAAGIVGAPTANPTAGTYSENQSVALTSSTEGATIYYTTDGSDPTITGGVTGGTTAEYTAPIAVTGTEGQSITTTVKAIAVNNGMQDSSVETFIYTIKQDSQTPDVPGVTAPSITTQPGNATVKAGETATFTIAASGDNLTYQWKINRNDGNGWVNIAGANAVSYTTSTVDKSCNGFQYKCVVSNSAGNEESNSAILTVQDAGGSDNPDTPNNTYQIIDGANSSWTHDSDGNITIRGNGDFSKFTGVKVDGNLIDRSNYTAKEGSTIITLKASYLNTLSAGTNTVEILWTDGSASTTFTIKANTSDNSNNNQNDNNNSDSSDDKPSSGTDKKDVTAPKTGDNTPSVWLFILLILSGTGLIITVKKRRENLNS